MRLEARFARSAPPGRLDFRHRRDLILLLRTYCGGGCGKTTCGIGDTQYLSTVGGRRRIPNSPAFDRGRRRHIPPRSSGPVARRPTWRRSHKNHPITRTRMAHTGSPTAILLLAPRFPADDRNRAPTENRPSMQIYISGRRADSMYASRTCAYCRMGTYRLPAPHIYGASRASGSRRALSRGEIPCI